MPAGRQRYRSFVSWWRGLLLALSIVTGSLAGGDETSALSRLEGGGSFVDLSLTEALVRLQSEGVAIVFTSELVRPEMKVTTEPRATTPRALLEELLAPHGLRVVEGGGGTLVVVAREPDAEARRSVLTGEVRSRTSGEPIAGAIVSLRDSGELAHTDAAGRFEIAGVASGVYTVQVSREGFVGEELHRIVVTAGLPVPVPELRIALRALPLVNEEIVVRPSRLSMLQEQPVAPLSLSRREIEALPHIGDEVTRALSLFPGTAANDVTARLSIHGGRRDELQIVLDGQELYDAHHLRDYDSALTIVPADELAEASLSTGNFAVRSGDRMSGVLDLTTTSPADRHHMRLGASLFDFRASGSGTFSDERGTWLASLRRGTTDLAGRIVDRPEPSFWDLLGKIGLQLSDETSLGGHVLTSGDDLAIHDTSGSGEAERLDTDSTIRYLWLTHQAILGVRTLVETTASSSGSDRDRIGLELETDQSLAVSDERSFSVLGVAQSWAHDGGKHRRFEGGFEARRYSATYDYRNDIERDSNLVGAGFEPAGSVPRFEDRFEGSHLAGWVSDRIVLGTDLTLEIGLRYDDLSLSDDRLLSPRVNLARRFGETGVLRAGWGYFHQSQRPYEIMVEDGETGLHPAERSEHRVLGYEHLFRTTSRVSLEALRIELYSRDITMPRPRYENLFETLGFFPEMEEDRVRIVPERARADGAELLLRGTAGSRFDWWLSYAYSRAEDRVEGRWVRRAIDQPHSLDLVLDWRVSRTWTLDFTWRYHSGWPTTPVSLLVEEDDEEEAVFLRQLGDRNSASLPSYHRVDLRASRRWAVGRGRLRLYFDVQNLFDRRNVAGFDTEIDEETPRLVVSEDHWVGVVPAVGISWEF